MAEIVRSGIMSVDNGQFEAGRSLGLSYRQTMISIVLPQAFKTVLPALANECIVLLRNLCCRIYRNSGPYKGRRYNPFSDVLGIHAAYNSCTYLPYNGSCAYSSGRKA